MTTKLDRKAVCNVFICTKDKRFKNVEKQKSSFDQPSVVAHSVKYHSIYIKTNAYPLCTLVINCEKLNTRPNQKLFMGEDYGNKFYLSLKLVPAQFCWPENCTLFSNLRKSYLEEDHIIPSAKKSKNDGNNDFFEGV